MNILNSKVSNKIVILSIGIVVVISILASTTYSLVYNSKKLSNNSYTTGILDITYKAGDTLELSNYIPMDDEQGKNTEPYSINIKNNGTVSYKFDLSILSTVEDVTNIISAEYIKIQVDSNAPIKLSELIEGKIYTNVIINPNDSIDINIRMWLDENTPNTEIGHIYSAKLVATGLAVINNNDLHTTSLGYQSLVKLGLDEYIANKDSGIFEIEDNDSYSYYFKGNIDYNYVLLNDKYYRIIRVDNQGNLRLIYSGSKAYVNGYNDSDSKDTIIGESVFNNVSNNGYTFMDENNIVTSSTIKTLLDTWYEDNIKDTNIESSIVDSIYCSDKELSFKCSPINSYSVSSIGNAELKYSIGLISSYELSLIDNDYIYNNIEFWTMSMDNDNIYSYNGKLNSSNVNRILGIKPIITVNINNIDGYGTIDNPFTIS